MLLSNNSTAKNYADIVFREVEMVRRLIDTYVRMYGKILESAEKMDIHTLDQACDNIDRTVGYIRKIIIKIPTIVDTKRKKVLKNEYEFHQKKKEREKNIL